MARCRVCAKEWPVLHDTCPEDGTALDTTLDVPTGAASAGPSQELRPDDRAGEYVIVDKIGQGTMGTVYGAVHPVIRKRAAVKVLGAELSNNAVAVERFVREARAVNEIGHPNIVDVFAFGALPDGRRYFVMEWLQGESLAERLRRGPLAIDDAAAILAQMCRALAVAHGKNIVHRDLKPDNVFLVQVPGERPLVKLLDFGIAKLVGSDGGLRATRTGAMVGTPLYVSPEQARDQEVDHRSDVYSLGVLAFECVTGRPPFHAESTFDVLAMQVDQAPPRPRSIRSEIPPPLEQAILRMLEKKPAARLPLDELAQVLAQLRTGGAAPRTGGGKRLALGAIAALALVGLGTWTALRLAPSRAAPPPSLVTPAAAIVAPPVVVTPAAPATPEGRLLVRVNAAEARFLLDGQPAGDGSGVLVVEHVAAGRHRVAVDSAGFDRREEVVEIRAREALQLAWELTSTRRHRPRPTEKSANPSSQPVDINALPGWPPR